MDDPTMNPKRGEETEAALGMVLYAWVGYDERGLEPDMGIKQALCPAGYIPMVSCRDWQLEQEYVLEQMTALASRYGKTIRLVRFVAESIVKELDPKS